MASSTDNIPLEVLRRPYRRTISGERRSVAVLAASLRDAVEQWCSHMKIAHHHSAPFQQVEMIQSQVRCIKQELLTYLGPTNTTANTSSSCRGESITRTAATQAMFETMVAPTTPSPASSSTDAAATDALAQRVWVWAVWLAIVMVDAEQLSWSLALARDVFSCHPTNVVAALTSSAAAPHTHEWSLAVRGISGNKRGEMNDDVADFLIMRGLLLVYVVMTEDETRSATLLREWVEVEAALLHHDDEDDTNMCLSPNIRWCQHVRRLCVCLAREDFSGATHELRGSQADPSRVATSEVVLSMFVLCLMEHTWRRAWTQMSVERSFRPIPSLHASPPTSECPDEVPPCSIFEALKDGPTSSGSSPSPSLLADSRLHVRAVQELQLRRLKHQGGAWPLPQTLLTDALRPMRT